MKNKMLAKNKNAESLETGLFVIFLAITIASFAFVSSEYDVTGFTIDTIDEVQSGSNPVNELKHIESLATLAPGAYYVDSNGIVYWIDDSSRPAIAKVDYVHENQKNRVIYVDDFGNFAYG